MARSDSKKRKEQKEQGEEAQSKPERFAQVKNNYQFDWNFNHKDEDGEVTKYRFPAGDWSLPIPEDVYFELSQDSRMSREVNETGKFSVKFISDTEAKKILAKDAEEQLKKKRGNG